MSQPVTMRTTDSSWGAAVPNPYDQRNQQTKAIQRWEKQKNVWATIEENLRRRAANGDGRGKITEAGKNMSQGPYRARLREEEVNVITNAVPSSVFTGFHTWQSTLRSTEENGAVRYLKLGSTDLPYALYGKLTDRSRLDVEHLTNTRVVFPEENTVKGVNEKTPVVFRDSEYYKERFHQYLPLIEQNMSHMLVPRAYLELCGQPPPWTTKPEDAAAAAKRSVPAVVQFPPPATTEAAAAAQSAKEMPGNMQDEVNSSKRRSILASGEEKTKQSSKSGDGNPAMSTEEEDLALGGPSLEISTTRVLFLARPGELAHGVVKIKNNGTTTIYYSWTPFQPITPLDGRAYLDNFNSQEEEEVEEGKVKGKNEAKRTDNPTGVEIGDFSMESLRARRDVATSSSPGDDGNGNSPNCDASSSPGADEKMNNKGETKPLNVPLRPLAKKSAEAKSFFFLSTQLDGVILPDTEEMFPFSVRARYPGRFFQHYELLMIPAASSRVIVELCAIIQNDGPSLDTISRPIADALEAKAIVDTQRGTTNKLAANSSMYEAVEIAKEIEECISKANAPKEAHEALIAKWRRAWHDTTYTALRIPFNLAVYEGMDALYENLSRTMSDLGQPFHDEEWDGSVQTLQSHLCLLRDAASRNLFREAFNILLRASTVSEREYESLSLLLQRVAGAVAFSTLAHEAGGLEDAVMSALGLRAPQTTRDLSHSQTGGGAGGRKAIGGGAAGAAGGGNKSHGKAAGKAKVIVSLENTIVRSGTTDRLGGPNDTIADLLSEASVKEEYEAHFFAGMRRLVADAVDRLCSTLDNFRCTVEAACTLPLLETTARIRAKDVLAIQSAEEIDVDFAVEAIPQKKKRL